MTAAAQKGLLLAAILLAGCVTSPEPHPPVTCKTLEIGDTLTPCVVYGGIGE